MSLSACFAAVVAVMCGCKVNLSMLSCLAVLPPSHTSTKGKQAASKLAHLSAPNQPDTLGLSLFLCVCMFIPGTPLLLPPRAQHNHTWPHTDSNCRSLFHCRTSNQRREQHTEHTHTHTISVLGIIQQKVPFVVANGRGGERKRMPSRRTGRLDNRH